MSNIAVDFDGTIVTHEYPKIGKDRGAIEVLRELMANGHGIILWTIRSGDQLAEAVQYLCDNGIELQGVNSCPDQYKWSKSPKAYAQLYIDDAALGCPVKFEPGIQRPFADWEAIRAELIVKGYIQQTTKEL